MSSYDNAIEAAKIEAQCSGLRVYVFRESGGYIAVNEEECSPEELDSAIGFAEFDRRRKTSNWIDQSWPVNRPRVAEVPL